MSGIHPFQGCGWKQFDSISYTAVRAPFTLIRTKEDIPVSISLIFKDSFKPLRPIFPDPTEIVNDGPTLKYTWRVIAHSNGTMETPTIDQRIKLIWWEAIRLGHPKPFDVSHSACVLRSEFKEFLRSTLILLGVHDSESIAFVDFWNRIFGDDPSCPYILVQLINPGDVLNYVPEMRIESDAGNPPALYRFYFRFLPVKNASAGIDPTIFRSRLPFPHLGEDAVIDLGGEMASSSDLQISGLYTAPGEFVDYFKRRHIEVPKDGSIF
jgi:hypothetical protein